jgi:TctA family transporter
MYLGQRRRPMLLLTTVPIFASILRVPFAAVASMIVVSRAIGVYAIQNALFDIWPMLGFGVVGYAFKKINVPLAPFTPRAGVGQPRRGCAPVANDRLWRVHEGVLVERPGP